MKRLCLVAAAMSALACSREPDPTCAAAADSANDIQAKLLLIRDDLHQLRALADQVSQESHRLPQAASAQVVVVPKDCEGETTAALQRAVTAERALQDLKRQLQRASRDWHDPNVGYTQSITEFEGINAAVNDE